MTFAPRILFRCTIAEAFKPTMFVPLTPIRCLHRAMDVFPERTGVVCGDKRFTYAQFGERCEKLATGLAAVAVVVKAGGVVRLLAESPLTKPL